jgi:hypothetical protein
MKKLIIALALLIFATPAIADTVEYSWTDQTGTIDHIVFSHKAVTDPTMSAQDFLTSGGFTDIMLGSTSPIDFVLDYPAGTLVGIYVTVYGPADCAASNECNSTMVMNAGSPSIYRFPISGPGITTNATWVDVPPASDGESHLIQINITVER